MYRRNGNPDPHESRDPRQPHTAIAYQDGRLRGDLDLPTLLKAIYRVATVFSLGFLLITMRAERNEAKLGLTPQAIAHVIVQLSDDPAIKAAFIKLLTPEAADPPVPSKPTQTKGTGRTKPRDTTKPKGTSLWREGEMIATPDHLPPIIGANRISLPKMKVPE